MIANTLFKLVRTSARGPLQHVRTQLARSNLAARCAVLVRRQMDGIIFLHLGHDIDFHTNGEAWLVRNIAPSARTFVDVGANTGDWSALFVSEARNAVRGVLFDASAAAHERLRHRFSDREALRIVRAAVSDSAGTAVFYEEPNAGGTSSLVPGFSGPQAKPVEVSVVTLDDALSAENMSIVDYLKIDAEGYDLHVLRGARRLLSEQAIRFLQFEYNDAWLRAGSTLREALDLLERCGYVTFLLKGEALYELPYAVYGEYFHYSNFASFPQSRLGELDKLVRGTL